MHGESPRITHKPREQPTELWQSKAAAHVSSALSKEERDRQESIFELMFTEAKFTELLTELTQFYVAPLADLATPTELEALFANLAQLTPIHTSFLEDLRQRRNDGLVVNKLGDVLLHYVS